MVHEELGHGNCYQRGKKKLWTLINVAVSGEQVLLTKHGRPVAEIRSVAAAKTSGEKLTALRRIAKRAAAKKLTVGPDAAHSADFLYETGMPLWPG